MLTFDRAIKSIATGLILGSVLAVVLFVWSYTR
jgi:hypothetical protein